MAKGITWEEADGMFEALTKAIKEQGLHDYQVTKTETGWQTQVVVIEMKCWNCNTEFYVYPEANYPKCPYCDKVNMVGECPNFVELATTKIKEQVTA